MTPKIIYKQRHVGEDGRKFSQSRNAHFVKYIGEREHVFKKSSDEQSNDNYNATHEHISNLVKYIGEREHVAIKKSVDKKVQADIRKDELTTYEQESSDELQSENEYEYFEKATDERDNGLFGYIGGKFSDDYNTKDVQRYVRLMSERHNIFHSIFSFTPESANEAGLHTFEDWEEWTKYHIGEIADGMNMKIENIEYIAAVHLKEGQPHVHIEWWDKEQQILINIVNPLICDKIRIAAIKSTFREQFNDLHNAEDAFVRNLRDDIEKHTDSICTNCADDYSKTIAESLNYISEILPKKGQFKYKYMSRDVKDEINKLTHYIIDNNPQFARLYDSALEQRTLYNEMLHSTDEDASNWSKYKMTKYTGKLNDEVESYIGNALLRIIKREKKEGRQKLFAALDAVPIDDEIQSDRWLKYSERESFEPFIQHSHRFNKARKLAKDGKYLDALELYKTEADVGNVLAEYEIADLYRKGLIGEKSQSEIDKHYKLALFGFISAEEHARRMKPYLDYRIGRMYYDGYGVKQNYTEAIKWLEKAADTGNVLAANTLAEMYRTGKGTAPNPEKAAEIYKLNAEQNAHSAYALARMYIKADEIPKDTAAAIVLLNKAKALNNDISPLVDYTLGTVYLFDDDFQNRTLARKYLELSAQAGNERAQTLLDNSETWQQQNVVSLVKDVAELLASCEQNGGNALSETAARVFGRGDLSREQIRELLLKLQDKENTAEM